MQVSDLNVLLRNNTGNKPKAVLINGFVVRLKVFQNIFSDIKDSVLNGTPANYLVVGQRGAGKTTLLHRVKYAIEDDHIINSVILPIIFNEEQYNITELLNFWETIGEYLDEYPEFGMITDEIQQQISGVAGDEVKAYEIIKSALARNRKKIIVFIENIDCFLEKIGPVERADLKEILLDDTIRLIGSTTTYFDSMVSKTSPFFNFFKVYQLDGLNQSESIKLLMKLGEQTNELPQIQNIIRTNPKRIESLRRLTGGNPRTMAYLFQIFLDKGNSKAIGDLYRLLDDLTFLYKAELDALSAQQQKVVDGIAKNWDAISVKELSAKIKLDGKHISSVLGVLERNQVIEIVPTKTKNNLYRLKDRFLNIWYLMRFGRKRDKENIIWLVRFYDAWCDKHELRNRIVRHIADLNSGKYDSVAALDMGNTFLSCENVPPDLKYSLYQTTKSYLPKELISELKLSETDLYESIKQLVKKKDFTKAESILAEIKIKDAHYYTFYYWIYYNQRKYKEAAELLTRVFELKRVELEGRGENVQPGLIAYNVAKLYDTMLDNTDYAVKFYKEALSLQVYKAAYRLGQIYYYDLDDMDEAVKYHRLAIEKGVDTSIMSLATIYYKETYYEEAEKLCLLAIEKGDNDARNNYSIILQEYERYDEAISVLETAIENGSGYALINLGQLYLNQPTPDKEQALFCFLKAVEKGVHDAYFNAGKYYVSENNFSEGERYLKMGLKVQDAECAHLLAHQYHKRNKWPKAEKLFIDAYNWGKKSAIVCLLNCAFTSKLHERKGFILDLYDQHLEEILDLGPIAIVMYCQLLVWNDKLELSGKYLMDAVPAITKVLNGDDEEYKEDLISELTDYFIQLMSKGNFLQVSELFAREELNLRQILKPVHFALMNYMKEDHPNEYLKAGAEIQETVDEIMDEVELLKSTKSNI
jgi:TPR repeat protein